MALSLSGTTGIVTGNIAALQVTTATIADLNVTPGKLSQKLTLATVQSATGTSVDFTSIPSWVKRITLMFKGVSTNGASTPWLIQIGDSGGIEITGYLATSARFLTSTLNTAAATAGFNMNVDNSTSNICHGSATISLLDLSTNSWVASGMFSNNQSEAFSVAGSKSLSATLDRVRITTTNGTDTFDAGSINIMYEG